MLPSFVSKGQQQLGKLAPSLQTVQESIATANRRLLDQAKANRQYVAEILQTNLFQDAELWARSFAQSVVVVDENTRSDFQQAAQEPQQDISGALDDVEDDVCQECRTQAALSLEAYDPLEIGGHDHLGKLLTRKYGLNMVASSKAQPVQQASAGDLTPAAAMHLGDGTTPHPDSFHLTRYAHSMPDRPSSPSLPTQAQAFPPPSLGEQMLSSPHLNDDTWPVWGEEEEPQSEAATGQPGEDCLGWFVCDSEDGSTRQFVIQGTVNVEHWLVNVTFDPVVMLDPTFGVKVHRGMYEMAEALYPRFMPLIKEHLRARPDAKISFSGHSLGGCVAQVLLLMYVHRGVLDAHNVADVYTFGAPSLFCEGPDGDASSILAALGLPPTVIRNVIMDRDIIPRAFSTDYTLVRDFMRTWGPRWSHHGGLQSSCRPLMYNFIGHVYILASHLGQSHVHPGEGYLPCLPKQAGLWRVTDDDTSGDSSSHASKALQHLMDHPHPLRILGHAASYGHNGAISRYHNVRNYELALGAVLRSRQGYLGNEPQAEAPDAPASRGPALSALL